jgi:glycosyltransferase involved in cell wall biosynthesis
VTFLGGLHWPPNAEGVLWFAREVWPTVWRQVPDALFTIIGKNPPETLTKLQETGEPSRIEITGYVEDLEPYLASTAAFIVPLQAGGGMRVKIIDAWSWGLPVVSTTIGAEGICYQAGSDLVIADEADAFGAAVIRLLQDKRLAERLGKAGRLTIEESYDWRQVYPAWDDVYELQ